MKQVFGDFPQYYFGRAWIRILDYNGQWSSVSPMPDLSRYLGDPEDEVSNESEHESEEEESEHEPEKEVAGSSNAVVLSETSESEPEESNPVDYDSSPWSVTEFSSEDE